MNAPNNTRNRHIVGNLWQPFDFGVSIVLIR